MTLKGWMLGNRTESNATEGRLRTPTAMGLAEEDGREPGLSAFGRRGGAANPPVHLGPYAPLVGAIREELEMFVANQLRLHLAIAERDHYVLASIEVECEGGEGERELLRRFVREFRPEQIKQYLAKEIIAGLRNASSIDLTQFAGLNAELEDAGAKRDEGRYDDLIAELANGAPRAMARPYRVSLVGRWSETLPSVAEPRGVVADGTRTPLAARTLSIAIDDALGVHRVELAAVPGVRYSVGKGEGCDVVVNGVYASRRHCELWFDRGSWWAIDTGSTNGIRVELPGGGSARSDGGANAGARPVQLEVATGATLVLAAHMRGAAAEYPRLTLNAVDPIAPAESTRRETLATPVTPIAATRRGNAIASLQVKGAAGTRDVPLASEALPFRIGRSRSQGLVVDWAYADVSGRHAEIVAVDGNGATVVVIGDNGVSVSGKVYGPGTQFRWNYGETLKLGSGVDAKACELVLERID